MSYYIYSEGENKTGAELAEALSEIPDAVTTLILSGNELGNLTGAEIAEALSGIRAAVTELDLSFNHLNNRTGVELAEALTVIPVTVKTLNLSLNKLGNKIGAELAVALSGIRASVTKLVLAYNDLGSKTGAELAKVLAGIPATVTNLNLTGNDLGSKSDDEKKLIIHAWLKRSRRVPALSELSLFSMLSHNSSSHGCDFKFGRVIRELLICEYDRMGSSRVATGLTEQGLARLGIRAFDLMLVARAQNFPETTASGNLLENSNDERELSRFNLN